MCVCLVMGGPASRKGTLCRQLVYHAHLRHYSSGDLLREEIAAGSPLATSIEHTIKEGGLVSSATVLALLKKQLRRSPGALVALDGFPRNTQNLRDLETILGTPEFAIFVDVPDDEMVSRIVKRAEQSGRVDDNLEAATARLKTFHDETESTLEQLAVSKVPIYRVCGMQPPEAVWKELLDICPAIGTRVT